MAEPEGKPGFVPTLNLLAKLSGHSLSSFQNWRRDETFPEQIDGQWDVWAVASWVTRQSLKPTSRTKVPIEADPMLAVGDSPGLERYRLAKAELAEMDLEQRRETHMPLDIVHAGMSSICLILREATETLQREFGPEAHAILAKALKEAERQVDDLFGADSEDDEADSVE